MFDYLGLLSKLTKSILISNLPFGVEVAAVVGLGSVLLLQLAVVLVEILVIYGRLDLPDELLRSRACSILGLRQLVHRCRVHMVDLAIRAYDGPSAVLLGVDYCLRLGEGLGLRGLDAHAADLVHQRREVLRPRRGNDLCAYLLQGVLRNASLKHRRLAHYLGGSDALGVVQVGHLPRHLLVGALPVAIALRLGLRSASRPGVLRLLVIS